MAFAAAYAVCIFAIALTEPAGPGSLSYVLLAGAAGALAPPFGAWTRAALARRLDGDELSVAYAVDGVLEESAFVFGPLIAAVVIVAASAGVALGGAALLALLSAVVLVYGPKTGAWSPARKQRSAGPRQPANRPLLLAIVCLAGTGTALGFVEVAVPAFADARGSAGTAGVPLAAFSVGGVFGSLIYGSRRWRWPASRRYALLLASVGCGLAVLPLADSVVALTVLIVLPGLAFLPALVTNSLLVAELSPAGPTTAAFAGVTAATNTGFAVGAAVAGSLVESSGTDAAFLVAALVAAASALPALALPARRASPTAE